MREVVGGIYLFDIDHTLINTDTLKKLISEKIARAFGVDIETFDKANKIYRDALKTSSDFKVRKYILFLQSCFERSDKNLIDVFYKNTSDFEKSLYPETKKVLSKLKENNSLGIFSEGYKRFQISKLKSSGLYEFFDPQLLFIFRRKTQPHQLETIPENSVLIDDNLEVLEKVRRKKNITPIWLNRKCDKKHPSIKTIYSLEELLTSR